MTLCFYVLLVGHSTPMQYGPRTFISDKAAERFAINAGNVKQLTRLYMFGGVVKLQEIYLAKDN